jgi:hypothetical protein
MSLTEEQQRIMDSLIEESIPYNDSTEDVAIVELADTENTFIPIQENSITLLQNDQTLRFSSADWFEKIKEQDVILAGLGGIGSWCALLLSRLDIRYLTLFDDDVVDSVNLAGQFYKKSQIKELKASAIYTAIREYSNYYSCNVYKNKFKSNSPTSGIMICGFDNMIARKLFYERWSDYLSNHPSETKECLFIDGRLSADTFQVLCIKGDDVYNMKKYEDKFLFDDSEADETICSFKQTSFMANMIASYMVNLFVNFISNLSNPDIEKSIPFFTEFDSNTLYCKQEY